MNDLILNVASNVVVLVLGVLGHRYCYKKYEDTKSRPILNVLPGVWTSLGLLGTFTSICISLFGIGGNETEIIDNTGKTLSEVHTVSGQNIDIIKIINRLIPAFTTSIIGLLGALVETLYTKVKFAYEEKEENAKLGMLSPEENIRDIAHYAKELASNKTQALLNIHNDLLYELIKFHKEEDAKNNDFFRTFINRLDGFSSQLGTLKNIQEHSQETFKVYNDNLNNNVAEQNKILQGFIDGFVNRMDDIFTQMHGAIQQQVQNFGEEQFSKTSQVLSSITERLNTISSEIISNQRMSVEAMMRNTNTEISNMTTSVTDVLGKLTDDVQNSLSVLNSQQSERLNSIITNYDSLAAKLSEQNTEFANKVTEQMQNEYSKVQEYNVQSLQQMVDLRTAYQEATEDVLTNTLIMNKKATADLKESMTGFVSNIQSAVTTQCNSLGNAISSNVESLNKAYRFIESLVAEIRQNYDQSVLAYGDAVTIAHRTNETSEKVIAANNKSLQEVEMTNKKISDVLDILMKRQENIEQLTKQINSVSGAIVELQKLESMLNKITSIR